MKTFITVGIIVCLISLLSAPAKALILKKNFRFVRGEFEIPTEIKKVINVSELQPFLDSEPDQGACGETARVAQYVPDVAHVLQYLADHQNEDQGLEETNGCSQALLSSHPQQGAHGGHRDIDQPGYKDE